MPTLSIASIRKRLQQGAGTLEQELESMERVFQFPFPLVILDDYAEERKQLLAEITEIAKEELELNAPLSSRADALADRRREISNRLDEIGTEAP